jgi:signal transduction histidine kinase
VSLRGRLVLGIALLLVLVLATMFGSSYVVLQERLRAQEQGFVRTLRLLRVYAPDPIAANVQWVGKALSIDTLEELAEDAIVAMQFGVDGGTVTELNPLGAIHRDPRAFPLGEIRAGMRSVGATEGSLPVAGGYCVRVLSGADASVVLWFLPRLRGAPLPLPLLQLGAALGVLAFGVLVFWMIERGVVRPLLALGETAGRLGAGEYAARAAPAQARELQPLVTSFNAMAGKVEGHAHELGLAVQRATEEAARKERAMLQSSRLAAIGTLAAGIAHEIQNPIGGMMNATLKLQKNERLGDRDRVYLELIREGLERISRIARRVLDFAPRQLEPVPFAVGRAVEGARALVEHRLRQSGVELTVAIEAGLPPVLGEMHEIQQVLLNLFLNSLDALETRPGPRRIECTARAVNGAVELRVADNGPGLEPELLPRVLDPFFSTKNRPDASGLGMFISYSIVKNHGGEMELDSRTGEGFRVRIRLPAAA